MSKHMNRMIAVFALAATAACSDVLSLDVEAPGRINDDDLNTPSAASGLVAGMAFDLTQAMDGSIESYVLASGDLWHGGSYDFGTYKTGDLHSSPEDWNGEYGTLQQARWVAENGLKRMAEVLPPATYEKSALVARAYLLGGFANRVLGELQCESTIDGGPVVPFTEHFVRADSLFARAIAVGTAAGSTGSAYVTAAYGGRASVRAWLGNWDAAEADAQKVPTSFDHKALFSTVPGAVENSIAIETTSRKEYSVWSSLWEEHPDDPRIPWKIPLDAKGQVERGQDGETLFYQQLKFTTRDSDISLTKGTEMLVLRAEARLLDGDLPGMTALLNEARAAYGMDALAQPASVNDAWPIMRFERGATVWLEMRRLHDLRRWKAAGPPQADPYAASRDVCFPISQTESRVNPNVGG
jgi:hypothetical protein